MECILLFSGNQGKLRELTAMLQRDMVIVTPHEIDMDADVEETGDTLEENALLKARIGHRRSGLVTLADDSGLEVRALDGRPGVRSARFAGSQATDEDNIAKLLNEMRPINDRTAWFRTVIALVDGLTEMTFEGVVEGTLANSPKGSNGFGYDPIFIPKEGDGRTFAQMDASEKNAISHRRRAMEKLRDHLAKTN